MFSERVAGGRYGSIDPCYPSQVIQAHVHELLFHAVFNVQHVSFTEPIVKTAHRRHQRVVDVRIAQREFPGMFIRKLEMARLDRCDCKVTQRHGYAVLEHANLTLIETPATTNVGSGL